jgi:hypothetical protein
VNNEKNIDYTSYYNIIIIFYNINKNDKKEFFKEG